MKKLVFLFAGIILSSAMFAQGNINKGNVMLGGMAGFESKTSSTEDGSITTINFSPNVGYFFMNQFAGGLRFNLLSVKFSEDEDGSSQFEFGPFVRYYFMSPAKKTNFFLDASYGFGSLSEGGESASYNSFSFVGGPSIFLTPSTALEFGIGYSSMGGEEVFGDDSRLNTFAIKVGFQIHLGGSGSK
jgi:hypothetical protein